MFNSVFPFIAQHVEPQTVLIRINQIDQLLFQVDVLLIVDGTFKHRVLNSLAKIQTLLCDASKTSLAGFIARCNV